MVLTLSNDPQALDFLYRSYASSTEGRRSTEIYTKDPKNGFIIDMPSERSKVMDKFHAETQSVGLMLDVIFDDDYDDEDIIEEINDSFEPQVESYPTYISKRKWLTR